METRQGSAQDDKAVLRRKFKELRQRFKAAGGRTTVPAIQANLLKFIRDFEQPGLQHCLYRPRRDEAPIPLTPETDYFFPVVQGDEIEFRKPTTIKAFHTNEYNIEEPKLDLSVPLDPKSPMVIFCPAVAIDQRGMRLGLGKGHYDRFFARHPEALRVGVVFHVQISSQPLPADSWDQAMDWIVSEKMILRINTQRSS